MWYNSNRKVENKVKYGGVNAMMSTVVDFIKVCVTIMFVATILMLIMTLLVSKFGVAGFLISIVTLIFLIIKIVNKI